MQTNKASCLNQTAALVWQSCDGKSSISEISQKLNRRLKKGRVVHKELIMFAVLELKENGLIENGEKEWEHMEFEGLSRREIVRKVGFASLVALPIVSSIVAPKAVAAQTSLNCPPGSVLPGQSAGVALFFGANNDAVCNAVSDRCCSGEIGNAQPAPHTAGFPDAARCCTLTATTADCPRNGRACSCICA